MTARDASGNCSTQACGRRLSRRRHRGRTRSGRQWRHAPAASPTTRARRRVRRHGVRPRLSDQGDRHDDARDAARRTRGPAAVGPRVGLAVRLARPRSRARARAGSARALRRADGVDAVLPRSPGPRRDRRRRSARLPLEYAPWTQSIYSDLGFMLLGFILEDAGQRVVSTGSSQRRCCSAARAHRSFGFNPLPNSRGSATAPHRDRPWRGRLLVGEVHDENAWALGGVAGHAGLFGTAPAVGAFARPCCARCRRRHVCSHGARRCARFMTRSDRSAQLARARLGHDAADVVVRHAAVAARGRPHRLHRHVALDRSCARSSTSCC